MRSQGEQFGEYTLDSPLGQGAYGEVWSASSPRGPVALKFLKVQEGWARRRFEREAQVLTSLDHPGCVALIDYGVASDGTAYIVTELLRGQTLSHWFWDQPIGPRLEVARQMTEAVQHAHRHQVVHRDLKPDNVFVSTTRTGPQVKVLDFGLARLVNSQPSDITETGEVVGTPGYMSPEQLRGDVVGPATDVYALGAILYLLLEERPPFEGESMLDIAMQHLTADVPAMSPAHRKEIATLTLEMLSKDPADRPSTRRVVRVLQGRLKIADSKSRAPAEHTPSLAVPFVIGAVVLFLVAVIAFVGPFEPADETPPPIGRATAPDNPLVRQASSDNVVAEVQDVGAANAEAEDLSAKSEGCGRVVPPGMHTIAGVELDVFVWIPKSYDANRPTPVLLALHDIGQRPEKLLETPDLIERAEHEGFVIVAPTGARPMPELPVIRALPRPGTWLQPGDRGRVIEDLERAGDAFCLDRERVFMIGHGNGAVVGEFVACMMPIRAAAFSAHRWWGTKDLCRRGDPPPTLFLSPINDPAAPVEDVEDCFGKLAKWSLTDHEDALKQRHGCTGDVRSVPARHAECFTASCDVELQWCRVEGGRDWKTMPNRKVTSGEPEFGLTSFCASEKGDFDYVDRIFSFFEQHRD